MFIPDLGSGSDFFPIPDLGSGPGVKKNTGSQIRIGNTDDYYNWQIFKIL
jgi:hypothetical protein